MAKTLYIDPFGGAAGDMLLGALIDLGVAQERLQERHLHAGAGADRRLLAKSRAQGFEQSGVR
jgi:uncharacterized protein (DUF111 family)